MTNVKYFILEECASHPGKYIIRPDFSKLPKMSTEGSFNLLPARLLNLSYAQYLRFCRDIVGGELSGKRNVYPIVFFEKNAKTNILVRLLNSCMNLVIWEREHPNWREHQEYLKQKEAVRHVCNY